MAPSARGRSDDPAQAAAAAYATGLRMLSGRELCEAEIRQRLAARGFDAGAIDGAVGRLRDTGALSDQRAVRAAARALIVVKRRSRLRAQRELEARGFDRDDAGAALAELCSTEDEEALVERALDRRLRTRRPAAGDRAAMQRTCAALIRQGFPAELVRTAVRRRFTNAGPDDESGP